MQNGKVKTKKKNINFNFWNEYFLSSKSGLMDKEDMDKLGFDKEENWERVIEIFWWTWWNLKKKKICKKKKKKLKNKN